MRIRGRVARRQTCPGSRAEASRDEHGRARFTATFPLIWRAPRRLCLEFDEVENLDQEVQREENHEEAAAHDADLPDVARDVGVLLRGTRGQEAGRLCSSRSGGHG